MDAQQITDVAMLGLGTMGHGIAQCFAVAGCQVQCYDNDQAARDSMIERVHQNLRDLAEAELIGADEIDDILARLTVVDDEAKAVAQAQFITEAVAEEADVKQALFSRIEPLVAEDTILASNSSSFGISQTAVQMKLPQRAVVTHWFNPPHLVPAVEVVPGDRTSAATVQTALALMRRLGKLAIHIKRELPGFLVNRVQIAMLREILDLYEKGVASAEDIDAAIRGSMGFRLAAIGPLQVCDFAGLDIMGRVYAQLGPDICSDPQVPAALQQLFDAGTYGAKTGKGFYEYTEANPAEKLRQRDRTFLALAKLLHGPAAPDQ